MDFKGYPPLALCWENRKVMWEGYYGHSPKGVVHYTLFFESILKLCDSGPSILSETWLLSSVKQEW